MNRRYEDAAFQQLISSLPTFSSSPQTRVCNESCPHYRKVVGQKDYACYRHRGDVREVVKGDACLDGLVRIRA